MTKVIALTQNPQRTYAPLIGTFMPSIQDNHEG